MAMAAAAGAAPRHYSEREEEEEDVDMGGLYGDDDDYGDCAPVFEPSKNEKAKKVNN